jgi:EmrB/QacA subfamily drug resistance transporter
VSQGDSPGRAQLDETEHGSGEEDAGRRASSDRRAWHVLAVVLVGSFMAVLDTTIVNVALPSIAKGTGASSAALEWVVSGYALTFGLALVPAGRLGDRFGTKPLFLSGLLLFTLASVGCGIAQSPSQLIAARVVQGLGAGIYYPAISATIQRTFSGRERSRAFGYLGSVVGISTAVGPLLGGVLIELAGEDSGWRWVFLVNLFVGAAVFPVALRVLPRPEDRKSHQFDPVGNLLLAAVLLLVLVPLVEGRSDGWPLWSFVCLVGALPVAAGLGAWEIRFIRRGGEPVLRPDLFRHRSFAAGQLLALLYFAGFTSLFFTLSILWQEGLGRSALAAGLLVVPFALGSLLTASNSDRFSTWLGRKTVMIGCTAMLFGQATMLAALHLSAPDPSALWFIGPLVVAGLGNGLVIAPNQDFVLGSVPKREAGTAGGSLIMAQRVGAAIGIAVIGTVLFGSASSSASSARVDPVLVHTAQTATMVNLAFVALALICTFALPHTLGEERASENQ